MKSVWKYILQPKDGQQVFLMPKGATILSVAMQHGVPMMWVEVDKEVSREPRNFQVHGTGEPILNGGVFVGSAVGVPFVWHIYEHAIKHKN